MGKSGGNGDTTTTVRYAPYIETEHKDLLELAKTESNAILHSSPYGDYTFIDPDLGFFMAGTVISDYPSIYDMFGKFEAGLDIEVLWNQVHQDSAYGTVIGEIISADSALLDDELEAQLAKMKAGFRDMNAVMGSSFIVADGNMRDTKVKATAKELADLRAKFTEIGQRRWERHLSWNDTVIARYLEINRLYLGAQWDYVQHASEKDAMDIFWPMKVIDARRVVVAALQGAQTSKTTGEHNKTASAISGALGGAAAGAYIGSVVPGIGTGIGAAVGGLLGFAGGIA